MTLLTPWVINGAPTDATIARVASYAESGGVEGVVRLDDLTVTPLDAPGAGFKVGAGAALVLNRYQARPNQTYTVSNDAPVVCDSSFVPSSSASAVSHLICVTVGDPDFAQNQHPWMGAQDPPDGAEATFKYSRFYVIANVPAGTIGFDQLNRSYPGYALARVDLPAGSTTYSAAVIKDVRRQARPRRSSEMLSANSIADPAYMSGGTNIGDYKLFPREATFNLYIPPWATKANVIGFVEGLKKYGALQGSLRFTITNAGSTNVTNIDEPAPGGTLDREGYNIGGTIPLPTAVRGTIQIATVEGAVKNTPSKGQLRTDAGTSALMQVFFEESLT